MKYKKMLGLLAIAAAALMAFAAPASATEITSPKGTKLGVGAKLVVKTTGSFSLDGTINITCQEASGQGEITDAGGPGKPVVGTGILENLSGCGNHTITVLNSGTYSLESLGGGKGTGYSTGAEVTVLTHSLFIGTRHCIYVTNNTHIGTVSDSEVNGGSTATATTNSAAIPQKETDSLCGNDAAMTGSGVLTSPDAAYLD